MVIFSPTTIRGKLHFISSTLQIGWPCCLCNGSRPWRNGLKYGFLRCIRHPWITACSFFHRQRFRGTFISFHRYCRAVFGDFSDGLAINTSSQPNWFTTSWNLFGKLRNETISMSKSSCFETSAERKYRQFCMGSRTFVLISTQKLRADVRGLTSPN